MSVEYIEVRRKVDKHGQTWFRPFAIDQDGEASKQGSWRLRATEAERDGLAIASACNVKCRNLFAEMDNGR